MRIMKKDDAPLCLPDFNECIIGVACNNGVRAVVYSIQRMIKHLMESDDMSYEDASDYLSYNTLSTWGGEGTPVYIYEVENDDEAHDMIMDIFDHEKGEEA